MSADRPPTNVPPPANQNFDRQHRFKPGHKKLGGRRKGTRNVTTNIIREAILGAPERVGADGRGKGGITGFFEGLGRKHPTVLANLIVKLLPQETEKSRQELEQADAPALAVNITKDDAEL